MAAISIHAAAADAFDQFKPMFIVVTLDWLLTPFLRGDLWAPAPDVISPARNRNALV
jgi:hypothetical protein